MPAARLLVTVALLATLAGGATSALGAPGPEAPTGLHGFLLRPGDTPSRTFARTPAFAWSPVRGASCYELRLATSRAFEDSTIVWSNVSSGGGAGRSCRGPRAIRIPAASLGLTLPWFTGRPYALYAQVRAITSRGATAWSAPYGFNMQWTERPVPLATKPGLIRWTPIEGATAYEVWYPDIRTSFTTHTNVADLREFYTFHDDPAWWSTVRWRVRAIRQVLGSIPNGLPAVSYGPWSPLYATRNPDLVAGPLQTRLSVSDVVSSSWKGAAHQLMPALTWSGNGLGGTPYGLFRVYAFTDKECVNVVFRGSVVGGPAFAPRLSGPLKLPASVAELDDAAFQTLPSAPSEGVKTFMADGTPLVSSETLGENSASAKVDLPDIDAKTTRYFWTVVPVGVQISTSGSLEYYDAEIPQDACEAGRVSTFAKLSKPAITASGAPYVAGLTPTGRLLASATPRPTVYSTPLVAWRPVIGATSYEVQWSRSLYPWRARGTLRTHATSATLKLGAGLWYYRVRGLNGVQVGTPAMTWSRPAAVKVVRPTFKIARR
ncbi:MAG: hypothetical protein KatS3mg012_2569 [Gaiellaceae bacterium]|nr:MAG: hypothetical protein KatS3mg012_2569 [Gaiellaceae bacterium]